MDERHVGEGAGAEDRPYAKDVEVVDAFARAGEEEGVDGRRARVGERRREGPDDEPLTVSPDDRENEGAVVEEAGEQAILTGERIDALNLVNCFGRVGCVQGRCDLRGGEEEEDDIARSVVHLSSLKTRSTGSMLGSAWYDRFNLAEFNQRIHL